MILDSGKGKEKIPSLTGTDDRATASVTSSSAIAGGGGTIVISDRMGCLDPLDCLDLLDTSEENDLRGRSCGFFFLLGVVVCVCFLILFFSRCHSFRHCPRCMSYCCCCYC